MPMTRTILITVFVSILFAGFESAADAAGFVVNSGHESSHEAHGLAHSDSHEHDGENNDDEHFCHCSVHAAALIPFIVACTADDKFVSSNHYDDRFSSLEDPPLLRPPNS